MKVNYDEKYFHKQQGLKECWFACFLMVRDMVKQEVSDYQKAKTLLIANKSVANQSFTNGLNDWDLRDLLRDQVDTHYTIGSVSEVNSIVAGLGSGYPVIIGLDTSSNGGHYCVVIGVDSTNNKLTIVDPNSVDGASHKMDLPNSGVILYYKK